MFCEGLYLNTIMVYAFGSGRTLISSCYLVGWGEFNFDFIKFLPYNKEFEQNASFNFHKKNLKG